LKEVPYPEALLAASFDAQLNRAAAAEGLSVLTAQAEADVSRAGRS
jgi:hypothetical protein